MNTLPTLTLKDAKRVAAGINRSLPKDIPVEVSIAFTMVTTDGADHVAVIGTGRPPFMSWSMTYPGGESRFVGHPEQH